MKVLAQIISWVFLPLFMPIYGLLIAMFVQTQELSFFQENTLFWMLPIQKWLILSMFILFSVVVPGLSLLIMHRRNHISTIEMDNPTERTVPIVITAIYCAFLGVLLLIKAPGGILPSSIYALPWGGFTAIVLAGIINQRDKISLHGIGGGMLTGFLFAYYSQQMLFPMWPLFGSIFVSGCIMSARIILGKHTLRQVIAGFLLGAIVMFCFVYFYP